MNLSPPRATGSPEADILTLLLLLKAHAGPEEDRLARAAWDALRVGEAERALEMARNYLSDPGIAAVHLSASLRVEHPLQTSVTCDQIVRKVQNNWPQAQELARVCGWHFVATRTRKEAATRAARGLLDADPYDTDARGLLAAAEAMDELPGRRWTPPRNDRGDGQIRARRKRDFAYLWRYLRPEDGDVTVSTSYTTLPSREVAQAAGAVHALLYMRPHEVALAGWRGTARVGDDGGLPRKVSNQLHGGYRLTIFPRFPMQLDGTLIVGEGRDEGALRLRGEWVALGVVSADAAAVWTPWGQHAAVQLGWNLEVERLATFDLRVEGQAGTGGPRGLATLAISRWIGPVNLRIDGQAGQAARPLTSPLLIQDRPGIEGLGGGVTTGGRIADKVRAEATLRLMQLHPDLGQPGDTAGVVGLAVTGWW